jgi:cytochrome b subunit of formate dehydrogenase
MFRGKKRTRSDKSTMSKARSLFVLAWLNAIALFTEIFSGFVLWLVLPYGSKSALLFTRKNWSVIHKWDAIPVTLMVIVHIVMHRKWIFNQIKSLFRAPVPRRALYPGLDSSEEPVSE